MRYRVALCLTTILLSGCNHITPSSSALPVPAHPPSSLTSDPINLRKAGATTPPKPSGGIRGRYEEGLAALKRFSQVPDCSSADVGIVRGAIEQYASLEAASANVLAGMTFGPAMATGQIGRQFRVDLQFGLADAAKAKGCYDLADSQYRELIEVYSGQAAGGIRDRARLGIDDLRELRAKGK